MKIFIVALLIAVSVVVFFVWANHQTQRNHKRFRRIDVLNALEDFISPNSNNDTWDLFLRWQIDNPYLESIRQRCLRVVQEYPPQIPTEDISQNGLDQIRSILEDLHNSPKR
jgi:hypothetical protein